MDSKKLDIIKVEFKRALVERIGGNKDRAWGGEDSLAIIEVVVNKDAEISAKGAKYVLSEEAMPFIGQMVNPSQALATLVKHGFLNARPEGKRGSRGASAVLFS